MAEAATDVKEIEPTEAANGQQPGGIGQRIRGLLRKKDKPPADRPNDAVKLGCGGLFRRKKRTEADGEAEETHKKPSEKPKSKGIKGGTVKDHEQQEQQLEPEELQLDTPSPAVAESVESTEAEQQQQQQQQQQPARPANPPRPLLELASNSGKEPAKNTEEKAAAEKAEEKAAAEKAEEKAAAEKAEEKAAAEKAEEKAAAEKAEEKAEEKKAEEETAAAERATAEKAEEKAAAEKAAAEKAAAEKAEEKAAAEKAEEKAAAEKAEEKAAAEKAEEENAAATAAAEKAAAEKAAAEKAAAEKAAAEKAEGQNGVPESDEDAEQDMQRAAQDEFQRSTVDMKQVKAKPGVTLEQGPHTEMWSSIVNKSFIGTGAFKRAAVCSLSSGAVLACNPADFTPTVEQVATLRENFDSRSVFSAAGFGLADTVYSLLEEAGSRDILCGADEPRGQTLLVCKTNTALLAAAYDGAPGRAADMLGDMRQHFISQGM